MAHGRHALPFDRWVDPEAAMAVREAALQGTVDELPVPDLLRLLQGTRQSGLLELTGANPGVVAMHDGEVTLALSAMGPTLQQVVIGSGLASGDVWEEIAAAADAGSTLTDALAAAGVDQDRTRAVLYDHTVGAIFELMLPGDDAFAFLPDEHHPIGARFTFTVDELLADAGQRIDAWKLIAEAIPSISIRMRLSHSIPRAQMTITADEWHVLSRVDGYATIADIIRELGMSAFAVCAVLHRLLQVGAVEPVPTD
jgi:hypothetical protein